MTEGRGLTKSWGGFVCRKRGDGCAACSRICSELADGKCLLKSIWERGGEQGELHRTDSGLQIHGRILCEPVLGFYSSQGTLQKAHLGLAWRHSSHDGF